MKSARLKAITKSLNHIKIIMQIPNTLSRK